MADSHINESTTKLDKGKGPATEEQALPERTANQTVPREDVASRERSNATTSNATESEEHEDKPPPLPPRRPAEPSRHKNDAAAAARRQERQQPISQAPLEPARKPMTAKEMAKQPYTHELRLLPSYNKTFSRFKLLLAFFLFSVSASILTISAILLGTNAWANGRQLVWLGVLLWIGITWGAVNMLWNAAELLVHCGRGSDSIYPRGIHPGAHVGMHLVFWLFTIVSIAMAATSVWEIQAAIKSCPRLYPGVEGSPSDVSATLCRLSKWYLQFADVYIVYVYVLLGLYCAAFLAHLTLFVWACVDTYHRRRLRLGNMVASNNEQGAILMPGLDMILQSWQEQTYNTPMIEDKVLQIPNGQFLHNESSTRAPPVVPEGPETAGPGETGQQR